MHKLKIITSELTNKEISLILKKYPHKNLSFFEKYCIHKLYYQNSFIGFIALSDHKSSKIFIEDIGYLKSSELLKPLISHLLKKVILKSTVFYNEQANFEPIYKELFQNFNFQKVNKELCLE